MELFLYKKIANVSSANEGHKIDTSSRARKTKHTRSNFFLSFLTISFFLFSLRFQWDLVCDRKHLKAMTQTVYMGGLLVGSVAFSALSDHVGRKIVAFLSIFFLVSIAGGKKK